MPRTPFALSLAAALAACNAEHSNTPRASGSELPGDAVALDGAAPDRPSAVVRGYELGRPIRSFVLPDELREVSAITALGGQALACVQDELGVLFELELSTGRFTRATTFGPPGDYEGLAGDGDRLWVLRSDGVVTELRRSNGVGAELRRSDGVGAELRRSDSALTRTREFRVGAGHDEYEGLALDLGRARLVVAPKSPPDDEGASDQRPLFALDLATGTLDAAPLFVLERDAVLAAARELGVALPERTKKNGESEPRLRLRLSEVAVHPETGELWLCSATDHAVVVVDRAGQVVGVHVFAASEHPQLEAATFLPSGELVLASEGGDGAGTLHVYGRAR